MMILYYPFDHIVVCNPLLTLAEIEVAPSKPLRSQQSINTNTMSKYFHNQRTGHRAHQPLGSL